jgi:hypothetical protein
MNETTPGKSNIKLEDLLVLSTAELNKKQKKHRVDLLATILLSLAAVLSALSAYQASRWYSQMNVSLAESSMLRAAAAKNDRDANRQILADMMIFLEWTDAFRKKDKTLMTALQDRFSEPLKKSFSAWLQLEKKGAAKLLPKGTPLELQEYSLELQKESNTLVQRSENIFMDAKNAARIGDNFIFSLVIFSLALFFGAVCTKIDTHLFQAILLWLGVTIMIVGLIIIAQLPWNSGF